MIKSTDRKGDNTKKNSPREEKLGSALRENLRRRKNPNKDER